MVNGQGRTTNSKGDVTSMYGYHQNRGCISDHGSYLDLVTPAAFKELTPHVKQSLVLYMYVWDFDGPLSNHKENSLACINDHKCIRPYRHSFILWDEVWSKSASTFGRGEC